MDKREQIKKIVQKLLNQNKLSGFSRADIDKATLQALLVLDQRSFDRWFNFLWKLEYLTQPEPEKYSLNVERIVELEVKLPEAINPAQRRLSV